LRTRCESILASADHAHGELLLAHLQTEHGDRQAGRLARRGDGELQS
jgi:hypothetical protein